MHKTFLHKGMRRFVSNMTKMAVEFVDGHDFGRRCRRLSRCSRFRTMGEDMVKSVLHFNYTNAGLILFVDMTGQVLEDQCGPCNCNLADGYKGYTH
jgi:hypothetical protein